jgi:hypothetical protein
MGVKLGILRLTVFEGVQVTRNWRKLYIEGLHDLYLPPNIIRMNKWRMIKWAGHVAREEEKYPYAAFWWGNLKKRGHLEEAVVDGMLLKCILKKQNGSPWTGLCWVRLGSSV